MADTAAVVLAAPDQADIPRDIQDELLRAIGATAIAIRSGSVSRLIAAVEMPPEVDAMVDLRTMAPTEDVVEAFRTLLRPKERILRVVGNSYNGDEIELVIGDAPLRAAMLALFGRRAVAVGGDFADPLGPPLRRRQPDVRAADPPHLAERGRASPRPRRTRAGSSCRAGGATNSAWPRSISPACSATSRRRSPSSVTSPISASRCRRSTTTSGTCSPRRSSSPTGSAACPTRPCSASRRS